MKRTFLSTVCALLSLATLNSCQQEDQSSLELTKQLTEELQTVVDFESAEIAAPRVAVMNKRLQDASVQVFALNGTALLSSADRPAEYADALAALGAEMGRVRASKPVIEADGAIDRDALVKAVGNVSQPGLSPEAQLEAGTAYYQNSIDKTHESAGSFEEYYGSAALGAALAYKADPSEVSTFTMAEAVEEVPARGDAPAAPAADEEEEVADDEEAADEE